jgi:hypothetical protein
MFFPLWVLVMFGGAVDGAPPTETVLLTSAPGHEWITPLCRYTVQSPKIEVTDNKINGEMWTQPRCARR